MGIEPSKSQRLMIVPTQLFIISSKKGEIKTGTISSPLIRTTIKQIRTH